MGNKSWGLTAKLKRLDVEVSVLLEQAKMIGTSEGLMQLVFKL
jgi:hypothetical protein